MGQPRVILLDTHIVLWLAEGTPKLTRHALSAIERARANGAGLAICDISLVELAMIYSKGRYSLAVPFDRFLEETEARFTVLPITSRCAARLAALPASYPRDPADRIIGATALSEGLRLITADQAIRRSRAVLTVW